MRQPVQRLVASAIIAAGISATGHTYSIYAKWASGTATFYVNPANADVSASAAAAAIQAGMDVWNTQSGSAFRYSYGGTVSDTATAYDNRNVALFRNTSNGSAIATTYSWWNSSNQLLDSDIIFWDGPFTFFTGSSGCGGVSNAAYIEDIAAHEFGHALGLNHSEYADATMYPSYSYCSQAMRTLAPDDVNGARSLYPGGAASNTAPSVTIGSPATGSSYVDGTTVTFTGSASDTQDGNLTGSIQWTDSVNGGVATAIGSGGFFSRVLTTGTHVIVARVTDSGGLQSSSSVTITVTSNTSGGGGGGTGGGITLAARGRKVKGLQKVDLSWNGASATMVDVYRDGARLSTTANDGAETDNINRKGSAVYEYRVCAAGTTSCSNASTVVF
jgi:hypothetical protein